MYGALGWPTRMETMSTPQRAEALELDAMKLHLAERDPQHHSWAKSGVDRANMQLRILLSYHYYKDTDLDALLSSVQSGEAGVQAMLAELAAHSGLYDAGDTPHLDDLTDEYGEGGDRDFWPFIRVQVSPDTFRRWRSLMDGLPGEDEANKAAQILEAVDVTVLSRGDATNP